MSDTVIKRTTLIVRDAEKSIAFYRDVIGMKEYYNQTMPVGGIIIPVGDGEAQVHLGIMEGTSPDVGKIGMLEWTDPALPDPGPYRKRLGIGDLIFVTETDDMVALYERLLDCPDCKIHCHPHDWQVPLPDGSGFKDLTTMSFFDPDGFFFEVNYKPAEPSVEGFTVKRVTQICRSVETQLAFYTEVMGLEVWYDQEMQVGGEVLPAGTPGAMVRVVILKGENDTQGMLGLMQYMDHPLKDPGQFKRELGIGDAIFVASATKDLGDVYARMKTFNKAPGAVVHAEPDPDVVPAADGSVVHLTTMSFFDPEGYFYELNERRTVKEG